MQNSDFDHKIILLQHDNHSGKFNVRKRVSERYLLRYSPQRNLVLKSLSTKVCKCLSNNLKFARGNRPDGEGKRARRRNKTAALCTHFQTQKSTLLSIRRLLPEPTSTMRATQTENVRGRARGRGRGRGGHARVRHPARTRKLLEEEEEGGYAVGSFKTQKFL